MVHVSWASGEIPARCAAWALRARTKDQGPRTKDQGPRTKKLRGRLRLAPRAIQPPSERNDHRFTHTFYPSRLKVYAKALDALVEAEAITRRLPRRWCSLADQLRRAALSIGGNITEGAMEYRPAEQKRFYRLAKRSAGECMFYLAAIRRLDLLSRDTVLDLAKLLMEIIGMLTAMITRDDRSDRKSMQHEQTR